MDFNFLLEKYKNKKIGFVGVGVSNTPIARLFCSNGIAVTIRDLKPLEQKLADEFIALGASIITGEHYLESIDEDMLFLSPAIKRFPELLEAANRGVILTGELPEFFSFCPCKRICVTGSDGKTTTTTLIAKILEAEGYNVYLGGNIGKNLFMELPNIQKDGFAVVEISSFQLQKLKVKPDVAIVTNVSPNHLDWHTDMDEYVDSKKRIFEFQTAENKLVLNLDNDITKGFAEQTVSKVAFFSRKNPDCRFFADGKSIYVDGKAVIDDDSIILPGTHNHENLMAAMAATEDYSSYESMRSVAASFGGVEHRNEFVRELDGVRYYNSSIDSSPTRTKAAIESFKCKLVVIAGGYDKNIPVDILGEVFKKHTRAAVLMGNTANKLEKMLNEYGYTEPIARATDMHDAVHKARALAKNGDCVILSPAAASFDLFKNFAERGNIYKDEVNKLTSEL